MYFSYSKNILSDLSRGDIVSSYHRSTVVSSYHCIVLSYHHLVLDVVVDDDIVDHVVNVVNVVVT